jgi:hypothetical protein
MTLVSSVVDLENVYPRPAFGPEGEKDMPAPTQLYLYVIGTGDALVDAPF